MGREARATVELDGTWTTVSLHLDGQALDLRGGVRRRVRRDDIRAATLDGSIVRVSTSDGDLLLDLGTDAAAWAKALMTAPPSLAAKLGVRAGMTVALVGEPPGPVRDAVGPSAAGSDAPLTAADLVVATVPSDEVLAGLVEALDDVTCPVWVVHGKGASAAPGAGSVREVMRAAGYRDTKVTAVSDEWSATRYSRSPAT